MSSIRFLHDAFRAGLSQHGFSKGAGTWRANRAETVLVVEPQKSQYGDQFYINLGVYLRKLGDMDMPKEIHCHIRGRIEEALPSQDERTVRTLLDFEQAMDEQQRHGQLVAYLDKFAAPFLNSCATLSGIREVSNSGGLRTFGVRKPLWEILSH